MTPAIPLQFTDIVVVSVSLWLFYKIYTSRSSGVATRLQGPPRLSFITGVQTELLDRSEFEVKDTLKRWRSEYGGVFSLPWSFGTKKIMVADPKAMAHFAARETYTYVQVPSSRDFIEQLFGRGILWSEGDLHKRQRKALNPAFSSSMIRILTPTFFDLSYKLKSVWDGMIESASTDGTVIEVQHWMNAVTLDSIGLAGFAFDFGALDGKEGTIAHTFDDFGNNLKGQQLFTRWMFLVAPVLPWLLRLSPRLKVLKELKIELNKIGSDLLEKVRKENEMGVVDGAADKSIIGLLIKAGAEDDDESHMTEEEVMAQMNTMLVAGYLTTSISLTWALIELCRHTDVQDKLREELSNLNSDPTHEQLTSSLPYLDAVVHEVLRLHPAVFEIARRAAETDILPLSTPITTADGQVVQTVTVPKGALVSVPIWAVNTSETLWGPDSEKFLPERWIASTPEDEAFKELPAREIQGHKHLLTFSDGPRICLGRGFALAEFKAVLSVLIRSFIFEFPNGEPKLTSVRSLLARPTVEVKEGYAIPLLVRKVN